MAIDPELTCPDTPGVLAVQLITSALEDLLNHMNGLHVANGEEQSRPSRKVPCRERWPFRDGHVQPSPSL